MKKNILIIVALLASLPTLSHGYSMSNSGCVFSKKALDQLNETMQSINVKGNTGDYKNQSEIIEIFDLDYDFKINSQHCQVQAAIEITPTNGSNYFLINPRLTFSNADITNKVDYPYKGSTQVIFTASVKKSELGKNHDFNYSAKIHYSVVVN